MEKKYVLLACPILKDGKDIIGNPFVSGEFIQSKVFVRDGNIDTGLRGFLWGKCPRFRHKNILKFDWAVVKTEVNENLLLLDNVTNETKFKRGIILYIGKIQSCADFILNIKDDEQQYFLDEIKSLTLEQILGTEEWKRKQEKW
jgi:hypothetical protein